jgi:hypothetical protein
MMSLIKSYLKVALAGKLPGESAHRDMLPPGRRLDVPPHEINLVKNSGVLVLLFPENDKLYTCLTRRPASLKHHPGQISFPGGKVEKQDLSACGLLCEKRAKKWGLIHTMWKYWVSCPIYMFMSVSLRFTRLLVGLINGLIFC